MITSDELLRAIEEASTPHNDAGLSVAEICDATGHGVEWVRKRLRRTIAAKKITVGHKTQPDISGRVQRIPCYRLVRNGKN